MPRMSDPGAIDCLTSYAPPTAEVGQGGALQSAEQQEAVFSTDTPLTTAAEFNAAQSPSTNG